MRTGLTRAGPPVHPILVAVPLGVLAASTAATAGYSLLHQPALLAWSMWMTFAGLATGLVAALVGPADYRVLRFSGGVRRLALGHLWLQVIALSLYGLSAWQLHTRGEEAWLLALLLQSMGLAGLGLFGWLGGELVFRHGVGALNPPESQRSPRRLPLHTSHQTLRVRVMPQTSPPPPQFAVMQPGGAGL